MTAAHCYWCPFPACPDCKHQPHIERQTTIHDHLEGDD